MKSRRQSKVVSSLVGEGITSAWNSLNGKWSKDNLSRIADEAVKLVKPFHLAQAVRERPPGILLFLADDRIVEQQPQVYCERTAHYILENNQQLQHFIRDSGYLKMSPAQKTHLSEMVIVKISEMVYAYDKEAVDAELARQRGRMKIHQDNWRRDNEEDESQLKEKYSVDSTADNGSIEAAALVEQLLYGTKITTT